MTQSLYERLGATPGITSLAGDLVDAHLANPLTQKRFANSNIPAIKHAAATFFIAGTGGPNDYVGKDMVAAHKGMNISAEEFLAVLDDAVNAMTKNAVAAAEQAEVLFILHSMRKEVMHG